MRPPASVRFGAPGLAFVWFSTFLAVYGPLVGRGLLLDDFAWIGVATSQSALKPATYLTAPTGFYRPLVSLTFEVNAALFHLSPLGYGITNLLLACACIAGVVRLGRVLGLSNSAAIGAGALWAFNVDGINMAVLWISGRTSLLATMFATFAVGSALRQEPVRWVILALCAMLSKEEAIPLPAVAAVGLYLQSRSPSMSLRRWMFALALPLVFYITLRSVSGAMLPYNAPTFYRYDFSASNILKNGLEYIDRTATVSVGVVLLTAIAIRQRLRSSEGLRVVGLFGLAWTVLSFATTIALPIRSSLYVCLPSVGIALASAACVEALVRVASETRRRIVVVVLLALPVSLVPVYLARANRWIQPALLSTHVIQQLSTAECLPMPPNYVLFIERSKNRATMANAFGDLLPEALRLATGRSLRARVVADSSESERADSFGGEPRLVFVLEDGNVAATRQKCP